ncbi:TetR/AcrR family transcriptional regulator [Streptoalloteichus hindustanus]|uniref:Transcriptional regulator, TetR family n=1 Tax=Streptoalloteichus hindustanus TaxID=2017 RepID=A0A1M5HZV8_STRHI|nr:TetR/AcrR family transcriptional regulator [Streptoalloteichus hindustanus]SHG21541.1 transcriptional regulator, TetR family [Streptoalloteichus hindustanus]
MAAHATHTRKSASAARSRSAALERGGQEGERPRRLRRTERREQILAAATRAFARAGGFTPTNLDDVAEEAGISRMILYRHFDSKADLYQAVLDRAGARLHEAATSAGGLGEDSVPGLVRWAAQDPDAFRLLFHHAAREPGFRDDVDKLRSAMVAALQPHMDRATPERAWAVWAAHLATSTVIEAIMAWLDAGQPDPDQAPERVLAALDGIYEAVRPR